MGVLLQAFFKMRPNQAVPSPADGDALVPWWWDHLASQANALRASGFTAVWLPPVLKSSAGAGPGADGYGPFDDYDIGSKHQMATVPTRFGTREQLQRCIATLRANGLDVYLDLVEHHRSGDRGNFVFRYRGADGTVNVGRFPKDPLNFRPNVPQDPHLGGPPRDDFPFGRELCPINAKPPRYVFDNLIAAASWLARGLDVQGVRLDDVKGLSTDFLLPFLNSASLADKFAVGEFFDGNRLLVNGWISNPRGMQGRPSAFDFPLKFLLSAMCNNEGRFNMADLDHAGLAGTSPFKAVTFVENHDTDLGRNSIVFNKILGYAYILTSEGYPCVYYRDYSTDRNCYGLKPLIDNLVWIHEKLAAGPTQERWKDFDLFAFERLGGPHLLVALNNDPQDARTITVATGFGSNVRLHDYSGNAPDVTTRADGFVTLTVPRNVNGRSYLCYSREGFDGGFEVQPRAVAQIFEGAPDLDIPPALPGQTVQVQRIWCDAGTEVKAVLSPDTAGWTDATTIRLEIVGPDGAVLASTMYLKNGAQQGGLTTVAKETGFHALHLEAAATPPNNREPRYELSVRYTAPQQLALAPPAPENVAAKGSWGPRFDLPNVAIHAHVLPDGKVLLWGRRDRPDQSLDVQECTPLIWDPATRKVTSTPRPKLANGKTVNLFCSGHTFLPDGRLLVVGGHVADSDGVNQASLYDWRTNTWEPTALMNEGRWYPTAVTLPDGSALVCSGSVKLNGKVVINDVQQIWNDGAWRSLVNFLGLPLFPRMHIEPLGRVFMSGPLAESYFLSTGETSNWAPLDHNPNGSRANGVRDYAPSVMYDAGKVLFVGGGNDAITGAPTNSAEIIDLNALAPAWRPTGAMRFSRRQHNATILPDGTVLVTGGTRHAGFNDLSPGQPVHTAELWDPRTGDWTELAAEEVDRCYHAIAVLLPDATVLSAGGGEYRPDPRSLEQNHPRDSHRDGQIFSPPYLFKGERPVITAAPTDVSYGKAFDVETDRPDDIGTVSWIRLPSVTHSFDQNQRINFLRFVAGAGKITITPPADANTCPPGHHMLFLLSKTGVPSVAKIVRITAVVPHPELLRREPISAAAAPRGLATLARDAALATAKGTRVTVGVTPTCPYGIGACWGGAYEALQRLTGVEAVRPIPNAADSTAEVFLKDEGLPDVERWPEQFAATAHGTYHFRGVEVTLRGVVQLRGGALILTATATRPPVTLAPLQAADRVQWDHLTGARRPVEDAEQFAYEQLFEKAAGDKLTATITGPLIKSGGAFVLQVRKF
jgi:hypothetical protein